MISTWNETVQGTREFVHDAGFTKVVLGVSGGIDSAVVAAIACEAVGPENVLGCLMPSRYSSEGSVSDAKRLAENWDFETATVEIEPLVLVFGALLRPFFGERPHNVTDQNIQARIRAVLLMAISNEQDRLLLNTCNKSEDYTGYCTLYGDSCGAIAPIGDLYKTEVFAFAHWINQEPSLPDIPMSIIAKPPSAELSPDQTDADDLPPYEILDTILRLHVDRDMTADAIIKAGHHRDTVERVVGLVEGSAFKRIQSAPVLKLTGRGR